MPINNIIGNPIGQNRPTIVAVGPLLMVVNSNPNPINASHKGMRKAIAKYINIYVIYKCLLNIN